MLTGGTTSFVEILTRVLETLEFEVGWGWGKMFPSFKKGDTNMFTLS